MYSIIHLLRECFMLTSLSIDNFTIIDNLELDFNKGMTAITGETGVGKSVMLDALKFAMGFRASQDQVLKQNRRSSVQAYFDVSKLPKTKQWLKARDLEHGNECLLRRVMTPEGRSRGYINGTPSTLADLKEISMLLVHMHDQHAHHALLQNNIQRDMVDDYAGCQNQTRRVRQIWQAYDRCQIRIKQASDTKLASTSRIQLLQYQIKEIEMLQLTEGEIETLEQQQTLLSKADENRSVCQAMKLTLTEDANSITGQLNTCAKMVNGNSLFQEVSELFENARIQIEEACSGLSYIEQSIDENPEQLASIEKKLSTIYDVARKHKVQACELMSFFKTLTQELQELQLLHEDLPELEKQKQSLQNSFVNESKKLSQLRKQGADKLKKSVTCLLNELNMTKTIFHVDVKQLKSPECSGMDKINFQIQGEGTTAFYDLDKVASGGELSRISLALQIINSECSGVQTLVFDEVDVGIGGATAEITGRLLRQLGKKCQLLCVTHQAQVASQAHYHLSVSRKTRNKQAVNLVRSLNSKLREKEVARMIAGVEITGQALAHARDMIHRAQG